MKKNKGFSVKEILVVLVIYAAVFSTISLIVVNSTKKTKFESLKYDATAFANNVRTYLTYNNNSISSLNKVYLKDVVDYDDSYNIVSPFDPNNSCSFMDSYVKFVNSEAYVTLKCDNYVLSDYDLGSKKADIYYVGEWKEKKPAENKKVEKIILYNYKENNDYVFEEFVPIDIFIRYYKENVNGDISNINEIDNYEKKVFYRTKVTVST